MESEKNEQKYMVLAKRYQNSKRSYLLVNPLQAKHLPTPPSAALGMMETLGKAVREKYPAADLVIGFAETATAIGCMVAQVLGAHYIQTTRESPTGAWLEFREEHSHAPEQKLYAPYLKEHLTKAHTVILVDDELSTGRTVRNMVERLQREYGRQARYVTASILYRLGDEDNAAMEQMGIDSVYLSRPPEGDYEAAAAKATVQAPKKAEPCPEIQGDCYLGGIPSRNPRLGVKATDYVKEWQDFAKRTLDDLLQRNGIGEEPGNLLVLGTEECMLPALLFGEELERRGWGAFCQATTRSPIGISEAQGYPIPRGWQIESFYEEGRTNYIYNSSKPAKSDDSTYGGGCRAALVVSDANHWNAKACQTLRGVLKEQTAWGRITRIAWIGGEAHVRNLPT